MENEPRQLPVVLVQIIIVQQVQHQQHDQRRKYDRSDLVRVEREFVVLTDIEGRHQHQRTSVNVFLVPVAQAADLLLVHNQLELLAELEQPLLELAAAQPRILTQVELRRVMRLHEGVLEGVRRDLLQQVALEAQHAEAMEPLTVVEHRRVADEVVVEVNVVHVVVR